MNWLNSRNKQNSLPYRTYTGRNEIIMLTFNNKEVNIETSYDENRNLYVGIVDRNNHRTNLTVNLGKNHKPNRAFVDTDQLGWGILRWLEEKNLGKPTGNVIGVYLRDEWVEFPEFEFYNI